MYTIRKAEITDLPQLEQIYAVAREKMRAAGNPNQWGNNYPSTELMTKDIQLGCNYLVLDNGNIVGTFVMLTAPDPSYKQIDYPPDNGCKHVGEHWHTVPFSGP